MPTRRRHTAPRTGNAAQMRLWAVAFCLILLFAACAIALLFPSPPAQAASEIRRSIQEQDARAKESKQVIRKLGREEESLAKDVRSMASRLKDMEQRMAEQLKALKDVQEEERRAQEGIANLIRHKQHAVRDLSQYLSGLWEFHMRKRTLEGGNDLDAWDKADREFTWTTELYRTTRDKLDTARERQMALRAELARQQQLSSKARTQLAAIARTKDELLSSKLNYASRLAEVRKERQDTEATLQRIQATIKNLNYTLSQQASGSKDFSGLRGSLPWPAAGQVVSGFSLKAKPPRRGLGIALAENAPVLAVSRGKVVHNEVMRGFGRVVILMHGDDYYSLYAYLSDSNVRMGQEIKQGHVLGHAGFYPAARGPGLYFELRFHQKAINPRTWLVAAQ